MVTIRSNLFGGSARTRVLIALGLLEESYPRELARVLGVALSGVQTALRGLERDGVIAARNLGRTRVYGFDPRYIAMRELKVLLARLAMTEPAIAQRASVLRRRPRRTGKPL